MFIVQSGGNYDNTYEMSKIPADWKRIKYRKVMFLEWDEHCLECGAPECYRTCELYQARSDGKCKRTSYGLKCIKDDERGSVRLKFLPWAKLQAGISARAFHENDRKKYVKFCMKMSDLMSCTDHMKSLLHQIYMTGRRLMKYSASRYNLEDYDAFVFRAISFTEEKIGIIFEFCNKEGVVKYKCSVRLKQGPNVLKIPVRQFGMALGDIKIVRVYPENNRQPELEIHDMDFVMEEPVKDVKCLVWDCDNTMWEGVLAEESDKPVDENVRKIIETLDQRGIVQSIASRNDYDFVRRKLERESLWDYFLYPQVTWNRKSLGIKNIVNSLNIGMDAVAFIDDSLFEREEVRKEVPQIQLYSENDLKFLLDYKEFTGTDTEEAKNRRFMYMQEEQRSIDKKILNMDDDSFLRASEIKITIFEPAGAEIDRCIELLGRTNQFNLSQNRYTKQELIYFMEQTESKVFAYSCEDKYGSYGIVGVLIVEHNEEIFLKDYVMSCRVAGKTIESAVSKALMDKYQANVIRAHFKKTERNGILLESFKKAGYQYDGNDLYADCKNLAETVVNYQFVKRDQ